MSENQKSWWEKVAIIATLTIAITGVVRIAWDLNKPPTVAAPDPALAKYAQQNELLRQQQFELLQRLSAMEQGQLKTNQTALENKLNDLSKQLHDKQPNAPHHNASPADTASNATTISSTPTPVPNISGLWSNAETGTSYNIEQNGKKIVLREDRTTQDGKITTAVGEGYLENNQLNVSFTTVFNTTGSGLLSLVDAQTLNGTIDNSTSGAKEEVSLTRQ